MTQAIDEPALLRQLREGQDAAFSELFEQHAPAVRRLALGLAKDRAEAEDITAETFFRVLRAVKRGNGPKDNVRAYLLTVARRVSWEWKGAAQDVPVSDDELTSRAGVIDAHPARAAEHSLIVKAFTSLPERWRTVLWQTEVEGAKPAVVAPQIGLSPNATAALARRARLGLRAAYLQAHLATGKSDSGCRSVLEKLGAYTAGSVTGVEAARISAHLGDCSRCTATHDELRDVCFSLRDNASGIAIAAAAAGSGVGLSGAFKSVFTGTKVKVAVAVASTAAAGVFGFSVGPAMNKAATDYSGLVGQQGMPEPTDDDLPSLERGGPDDGYALPNPGVSHTRDAVSPAPDAEFPTHANASVAKQPRADRVSRQPVLPSRVAASPQVPERTTHSVPATPLTTLPSSTQPAARSGSYARAGTTTSTTTTTTPTSSESPSVLSGLPLPDYELCASTYTYRDTYNEAKNRREVYEFSYNDGQGHVSIKYHYDDGRTESRERYWYDFCP